MSKNDIKQQARALRQSGKFDPKRVATETAEEQLRALGQEDRNQCVFDAASECERCARERREKDDPEALCPDHLARALGF